MSKSAAQTDKHSPFFDLLADADEIQIREATASSSDGVRSFVVHIKSPTPLSSVSSDALPGGRFDPGHMLQSAELLLESSDYVLARNLFSYLLNDNLRDARALRGLGVCLFHLGDRVSARKCFRAWHELHRSEEALLWLAKSFVADSDYASALTALGQITQTAELTDIDRFEFMKILGTCHAKQGNTAQAETAFRAALDLQPQNEGIWVNLGSLELQRGSAAHADRSFRQALQIQPRSSKAYCGLGLVALLARNPTLACAYFHKALELDAENWLALEQWVAVFNPDQDSKRLEMHMLKYLEAQPRSADGLALAADIYSRIGNTVQAKEYMSKALDIDPKNVRALVVKSRTDVPSI